MTAQVSIHFHQELNDFLPAESRNVILTHELKKPRSIKDFIESMGVPHTEIDLIIINSKSVGFDYLLQNADRIDVYPIVDSLPGNIQITLHDSPLRHIQPKPLTTPRFILDVHLGKLAAYLRMLGFDTLYRNDYDDPALAEISANKHRILLTCDRQLLMRKQISYGYFVRARQPKQQLLETLLHFNLYNKIKPFTRCMHCNGKTQAVNKQEIEDQLLPDTKKYYNEFYQCKTCNKIYWQGSHYLKMKDMLNKIKFAAG